MIPLKVNVADSERFSLITWKQKPANQQTSTFSTSQSNPGDAKAHMDLLNCLYLHLSSYVRHYKSTSTTKGKIGAFISLLLYSNLENDSQLVQIDSHVFHVKWFEPRLCHLGKVEPDAKAFFGLREELLHHFGHVVRVMVALLHGNVLH